MLFALAHCLIMCSPESHGALSVWTLPGRKGGLEGGRSQVQA